MKLLFVNNLENHSPPEKPPSSPKGRLGWVLLEQVLNACIIGGITCLATLAAGAVSWKAALIAFGITALIELRKYRGLK